MITKELLEISVKENKDFIDMVLKNKYCKDNEKTYEDVINRIIKETNITDKDQIELLKSGKFIPAGSILAGANSYSNCYTVPIKRDSIENIFDCLKEMARTFSFRGGVGTDLTVLRPSGSNVNNSAKTSSGAVSFMPMFNSVGRTIGQNNRR